MATEQVDDGPAFPSNYVSVKDGSQWTAQGMTLRDFFAAKALELLIRDDVIMLRELAVNAYEIADAMLTERAK